MIVLRPGHLYELDNFERPAQHRQRLQFIEKEPVSPGATELRTVSDGTTNEEILRMLIDRMQSLQSRFPCRENAIVVTKLEESLMWLEKRTTDRVRRGVEGKHIA